MTLFGRHAITEEDLKKDDKTPNSEGLDENYSDVGSNARDKMSN